MQTRNITAQTKIWEKNPAREPHQGGKAGTGTGTRQGRQQVAYRTRLKRLHLILFLNSHKYNAYMAFTYTSVIGPDSQHPKQTITHNDGSHSTIRSSAQRFYDIRQTTPNSTPSRGQVVFGIDSKWGIHIEGCLKKYHSANLNNNSQAPSNDCRSEKPY